MSSRTLGSHWSSLHLKKLLFYHLCVGEEKVGTKSPVITEKWRKCALPIPVLHWFVCSKLVVLKLFISSMFLPVMTSRVSVLSLIHCVNPMQIERNSMHCLYFLSNLWIWISGFAGKILTTNHITNHRCFFYLSFKKLWLYEVSWTHWWEWVTPAVLHCILLILPLEF